MSIKYLNKAFECNQFNSMEKLLMIAISDTVNDDGFGYPGYKKLMVKTSMAKATLSKHINILKNAGIFDVEPHGEIGTGRKVNTYQVHEFWNFKDLITRLKTSRDTRKVQPLNLSQDTRKVQSAKSSTLEPRKVQPLNPISSTLEHEPSVLTISKEPSVLKSYAYSGERIKINQEHFDEMLKNYPNLDLIAELNQLDLELRDKKSYWLPLQAKLNYRNKQAGKNNGKPKQSIYEQNMEAHERDRRRLMGEDETFLPDELDIDERQRLLN